MKGMYFDDIHSYDDLNLVLSSVEIPPASVKKTFVDIPGGDGSVDLTEALGEVKFNDRECSFTFTVFPYEDFEEKKSYISNILNGKRCKLILDKDPYYYWEGRCFIDRYASEKNMHNIVITATIAPYKMKKQETTVIVPAGTRIIKTLTNGRKTVIPTITTTAKATIIFNGNTFELGIGTHKLLDIEFKYGSNRVTVTSTATVKFTYQEGDL